MAAATHCAETDKAYCLNISAPFLVEVPPFKAAMTALMPYVDFIFGNETEARAFGKSEGWATEDVAEIALRVSRLPKASGARPRTVVFTQGKEPTVVAGGGKVTEYPVQRLDPSLLVDTNGAGDAFVGGFLSQLACGKTVSECCRAGSYAAREIIQLSGCAFPAAGCQFSWGA